MMGLDFCKVFEATETELKCKTNSALSAIKVKGIMTA